MGDAPVAAVQRLIVVFEQSGYLMLGDSAFDWLLGLNRVKWSDPGSVLGWTYPPRPWQWALLVLAAAAVAGFSYRRLLGPLYARIILGVVRALLVLVAIALLLGPKLTVYDKDVEPDLLFMLVDRSASMAVADALAEPGDAAPISRGQALRASLRRQQLVFADESFLENRRIVWLGFDEATYEIDPPWQIGEVEPPVGQATALRTAIEQAMQRAAGRPVAGIVVMSDGRSSQSTGAALVRSLRGAAVFAVPVGGDVAPLNFSVRRVDAPQKAFVKDDVPVDVWIGRDPADGAIDPDRLHVRLIDAQTDVVIKEKTWGQAPLDKPLTLTGRSNSTGTVTWRVQVQYDAPQDSRHSDPVAADNQQTFSIEMLDEQLRVLYIEGYPRWEYRYLKNMLIRERTIRSSMLLVSADQDFVQEGDDPIVRLPSSAEEWSQYDFDVVILGDVPPLYLSPAQIAMLRDHVAVRGAGLLWIGGAYHTPRQYEGTSLADLLPMRLPGAVDRFNPSQTVSIFPWPLADALNVLELKGAGSDDGEPSWPSNLPALNWVQDIGPLKQTAEVLAGSTQDARDAQALPLVVRMRYGAGQSVYVATDETWRWRYGRGELYFGQFWMGLIRMLGRHRVQSRNSAAEGLLFDISHRRAVAGQSLVVSLDVDDAVLLQRNLPGIAVSVRSEDEDRQIERLELHPQPRDDASALGRTRYRANWRPGSTGRLVLRVVEPALDHLDIRQSVQVVQPDDEMRQTRPDHPRLARLAADSNGKVIALNELDRLATAVPHVARINPSDESEPLWNSPLTLILVLLLATGEWVGRKLIRLI